MKREGFSSYSQYIRYKIMGEKPQKKLEYTARTRQDEDTLNSINQITSQLRKSLDKIGYNFNQVTSRINTLSKMKRQNGELVISDSKVFQKQYLLLKLLNECKDSISVAISMINRLAIQVTEAQASEKQ